MILAIYSTIHLHQTLTVLMLIIVGLARADSSGKDIDMFMFAMQLYQIEMYTVEKLQNMK